MMKNCRKALWIVIVLIVAIPTILFWGTNQIQIYKFKMTKDEVISYNQLIQSYNEIKTSIERLNAFAGDERRNNGKAYETKKQELFDETQKLSKLFYKFPDKYNEIYSLLYVSTKNYYPQLYIAAETYVPDHSKKSGEDIAAHFLISKEWRDVSEQLEEWLFDPKYVPNARKLDEIKGKMDELLNLNK